MADAKIADHNCAAKLLAALLDDGFIIVPSVEDARANSENPENTDIYICIDMGPSGVICIVRPKNNRPVSVQM